jgi:hypothetical protein
VFPAISAEENIDAGDVLLALLTSHENRPYHKIPVLDKASTFDPHLTLLVGRNIPDL